MGGLLRFSDNVGCKVSGADIVGIRDTATGFIGDSSFTMCFAGSSKLACKKFSKGWRL